MSFFFYPQFLSASLPETLCNRYVIHLFFCEAALKRASLRLTARRIIRILSTC